MVFYLRWIFWATVVLLFGAFLHYSLPQWDVVRIADTYEQRVNPGNNSLFWARGDVGSNTNAQGRDVFFIQTIQPNGAPMVFRNEDRPLYFKFDTSNLQAEAADAKSTAENPKWVAVRHYGWRAEVISIYPNALKIKPVDGPDARVIPWFSIAVLVGIIMVVWAIVARWLRFKRRYISPTLDKMDDTIDGWWMKLTGKNPDKTVKNRLDDGV